MRGFRLAALSFALTILLAARVWAAPGFVGMQVQELSPDVAAALGRDDAKGLLVRDVALGGPADLAGFRRGDLIVGFAGTPTDNLKQLVAAIGKHRAGETVDVRVYRGGNHRDLKFTLGEWPDSWRIRTEAVGTLPDRGLTLVALTSGVRKSFRLRWGATGVVVSLVDEAAGGPLQRGDLIVQINQQTVWQPAKAIELYRAAKQAGRHNLLLLVERVDGFHFVLLPVG